MVRVQVNVAPDLLDVCFLKNVETLEITIQMQCGTCRKHGDPLLPDSQVLENKLLGKTKVCLISS